MAMLGSIVMRLLADLMLDRAATTRRSFDAEMSQYLRDRKFQSVPPQASADR